MENENQRFIAARQWRQLGFPIKISSWLPLLERRDIVTIGLKRSRAYYSHNTHLFSETLNKWHI